MFRARNACARFSTKFNLLRTRPFCKDSNNNDNKKNKGNVDSKTEANVSTYNESYSQLDNFDFMTAAKILFKNPPKKKKFGIDFHLVQLFFACMPSLAVYLVAQYARYEMRKMEAELEEKKKLEEEEKKKQEEEKAKEIKLIATEGKKGGSDQELLEVKSRLGKLEEAVKEIVVESKKSKLEEAVKEIVVESKKQSADSINKSQQNASEPGEAKSASKSSSSMEQDKLTKQKFTEQTPSLDQGNLRSAAAISDTSLKDQKDENQNRGPCTKR